MKRIILPLLVLCIGTITFAQKNITNPVIKRIADCGVMKYNGKYYIGGVGTEGDFYVSSDLVNWGDPIHVIDMDNDWTRGTGAKNNQIHANDMVYLNGTFHFYWSVNYWGRDRHAVHMVHAQSDNVLGPYYEPDKTTWLDNRIDPKLFIDDDGQLYMYMVRFTEGNAIWVRKMKNPAEFESEPFCLFASLPDTWETMDNRVAEGPWVIKYRDQYYMMYNANHTGTSWGNYQLGVAQADSPILFNNGNKYSYPVVGCNLTELSDRYADILRYSRMAYDPMFSYTETQPIAGWEKTGFDDASWQKGESGFAARAIAGSTTQHMGTKWTSDNLWLRKEFTADKNVGNIAIRIKHHGDTKIMLNGKEIYNKQGRDFCIINLDAQQRKAIVNGTNTLAVETAKGRDNFFDIAIFDIKDQIADDILMTPGQPNILRGPNGFEWWLIYMANRNDAGRDQYIDRVQFFDKTLYVDGITGPNTPGYHPVPALPTFATTGETAAQGAFTQTQSSTTYLFETGVKTSGDAGAIAWWEDENNYAKVGLNAAAGSWYLTTCINGNTNTESYQLAPDFRWGVYHNIRIERNGESMQVWLDELPAPGRHRFCNIIPASAGYAGTFDNSGNTLFDGTIYTIGFDNVDHRLAKGEELIKGDALTDYELSFQLYGLNPTRNAGCYPIYVDTNNYVKATFNGVTGCLDIVTVVKGKEKKQQSVSLENMRITYPDVKYTDMIEKGYRFGATSWINGIYLNRSKENSTSAYAASLSIQNGKENAFNDNMFNRLTTEYLIDGKWHSIDTSNANIADNPMYNYTSFEPTKMEGLRFINSIPTDNRRHIYKIIVNECLKENYNFRSIRRGNDLYLFIDGKEVAKVDVTNMPASRFGLCAGNYAPSFNGILYYHIGNK